MARKGENIYKRKDGRWEGRYIKSRSSTGKANYGYVYAKSYREVKAKLISQSSCTSNSVTVDPEISSDQFEQVAMEWFQAICPKVKESTSNKYRNLLSSYILPVFGSKQLRDIYHLTGGNNSMSRFCKFGKIHVTKGNVDKLLGILLTASKELKRSLAPTGNLYR